MENFLSNNFYQSAPAVQEALIRYLQAQPPTIENSTRLLGYYIRKERAEDAIELYKRMLHEFPDRKTLTSKQLLTWERAEINLRNLMSLLQEKVGGGLKRRGWQAIQRGKG